MQPNVDVQRISRGSGAVVIPYRGYWPKIDSTAWIALGAVIVGDTEIGAESSVWFGCVVRADVNTVRIGKRVNLQDGVICHVQIGIAPLVLEDSVSVGHGAILHGCTLKEACLVGIGARVLDHAVIGSESLIAAGAVIREGTVVPTGELWAGIPAVKKRDLSAEERQGIWNTAERYVTYRLQYSGQDIEVPPELLPRRKA